ncbi:hypothetical protein ABZ468_11105 [Streptomyces sp. NPDC005708]|uniref:hypothetical protein n=1 Tax=Streptomyces sp. NPDC005708 TaxID=3154564 RepID=UPI0033FFA9B9
MVATLLRTVYRYNEHRPHEARTQLPPATQEQPAAPDGGALPRLTGTCGGRSCAL